MKQRIVSQENSRCKKCLNSLYMVVENIELFLEQARSLYILPQLKQLLSLGRLKNWRWLYDRPVQLLGKYLKLHSLGQNATMIQELRSWSFQPNQPYNGNSCNVVKYAQMMPKPGVSNHLLAQTPIDFQEFVQENFITPTL